MKQIFRSITLSVTTAILVVTSVISVLLTNSNASATNTPTAYCNDGTTSADCKKHGGDFVDSTQKALQVGIGKVIYDGALYMRRSPFSTDPNLNETFIRVDSSTSAIPAVVKDNSNLDNYCYSASSGYGDWTNYIRITSSGVATLFKIPDWNKPGGTGNGSCTPIQTQIQLADRLGPQSPFYITQDGKTVYNWRDDQANPMMLMSADKAPVTVYLASQDVSICPIALVIDGSNTYFFPMSLQQNTDAADQGSTSATYAKYIAGIRSGAVTTSCRMNSIMLHSVYYAAGFISRWASVTDKYWGNWGAGTVGVGYCGADQISTYGHGSNFGTRLQHDHYGNGIGPFDACSGKNSSTLFQGRLPNNGSSTYSNCLANRNGNNNDNDDNNVYNCTAAKAARISGHYGDSGPIDYNSTDYYNSPQDDYHTHDDKASFDDCFHPDDGDLYRCVVKAPYTNTEKFNLIDSTGAVSATGHDGYQLQYPIPKIPSSAKLAKMNVTPPDNMLGATPDPAAALKQKQDPGTAESSCNVSGVGWIVCPVVRWMADLNDAAFKAVTSFFTDNSQFTSDAVNDAWSKFRDFANVAFVIVFLIIIYSQMTGAGISNYGIKRLLPKLIIAIILVNASYWICIIMADISNIAGNGLYSLLHDLAVAKGTPLPANATATVAASVLTIAGAVAALYFLVMSLPVVLLAILFTLILLIARQMIIMIIIIVSPLAFVAYLLPNTESWFKRWWNAYSKLLLVYPIMGIVFGVSVFASKIFSSSDQQFMQVAAIIVAAIPMFSIPLLLTAAIEALGAAGGRLTGALGKGQNWAGNKANGAIANRYNNSAVGRGLAARKANREVRRNQRYAAAVGDTTGSLGWRQKMRRKAAFVSAGHNARDSVVAGAQAVSDKAFEADVAGHAGRVAGLDSAEATRLATTSQNEAERTAAIRHVMKTGSTDEKMEVIAASGSATERGRTAARSGYYESGLSDVAGTKVGDMITAGTIDTTTLRDAAVANAADGNVTQKQWAKSGSASTWLAKQVNDAKLAGNADATKASGKLKIVHDTAATNDQIRGDINDQHKNARGIL